MFFQNVKKAGKASAGKAEAKKTGAQDDLVLARPKGVSTAEYRRKQRKSEGAGEPADMTDMEMLLRQHAFVKIETARLHDKNGKTSTKVEDWKPKARDGDYGSKAMEDLCTEFAEHAADIQKGFREGE